MNLEQSVCKGQSRKSILDGRDLQRLKHGALQTCCCGNHCIGSGTLPEIMACEHSLLCHSLMQIKALPCVPQGGPVSQRSLYLTSQFFKKIFFIAEIWLRSNPLKELEEA